MSVQYKAVQWNPQKKHYDRVLAAGVALYVGAFVGMGAVLQPNATAETLLIRAFGTGALLLLHITLCIGPLCRLDPRFLPLLYNRRHLGVTTFLLGLSHGGFAIAQFHALGDLHPLVSVLASNPRLDSVSQFPFQPFGLAALTFLFLMAATSHDFWLANLTAPVWKALHMGVYLAYGSLVIHVSFGALHSETHPALPAILAVGFMSVLGLHLAAGWRERAGDAERLPQADDGYVDVCAVDAIPEARAHVVALAGERIAVFRYDGCVSAISNVCQHQNGPLGEGKVVDGCVVCPWHGYQYLPDSGRSPEPFTEKIPTFHVRVRDGRVWVDPNPNPPGTRVEPARVEAESHGS